MRLRVLASFDVIRLLSVLIPLFSSVLTEGSIKAALPPMLGHIVCNTDSSRSRVCEAWPLFAELQDQHRHAREVHAQTAIFTQDARTSFIQR